MSVKNDKPHLYVIPEDEADRQIALGFETHYEIDHRRIQVLPPAGGWKKVADACRDEYVPLLQKFPHAYVVMVIDFDEKDIENRRACCMQEIPDEIADRVFILGSSHRPEILRTLLQREFKAIRGYEAIGSALADDCHAGTDTYWNHIHLRHYAAERSRMEQAVKEFLFKSRAAPNPTIRDPRPHPACPDGE